MTADYPPGNWWVARCYFGTDNPRRQTTMIFTPDAIAIGGTLTSAEDALTFALNYAGSGPGSDNLLDARDATLARKPAVAAAHTIDALVSLTSKRARRDAALALVSLTRAVVLTEWMHSTAVQG